MFRVKHLLAGLAVGFGLATSAFAWPDKAITIIVPFPPGGSTDTLARAIAPGLQAQLGQNVIVENKPGATGTIGAGLVKRAPADGYTLFVSSLGPFVIAPHLYKSVAYDPNRDFDLLTVAVQAPNVLVVPANAPHKSVADDRGTQGEAGQADLCVVWRRLVGPPDGGTLLAAVRDQGHPCAVQGRRAGHHGPARRTGGCLVPEHQRDHPARARRQASGAGHHVDETLLPAAGRPDAE